MKTKIMNWLERHEYIYGFGLLLISLATVSYGGAYLGSKAALKDVSVEVNLLGPDGSVYHI